MMPRNFLALGLVAVSLIIGCRPKCDVSVRKEIISPDRRYVVTLYDENCHATSPAVTVISIRSSGSRFDEDDYVFSARGHVDVDLRWTTAEGLAVEYQKAETFRSEGRWKDVEISYHQRSM